LRRGKFAWEACCFALLPQIDLLPFAAPAYRDMYRDMDGLLDDGPHLGGEES
jgi:hypothetical protein